VKENPDVVVAILNAASLERHLYLVAELIELSPRTGHCVKHDGRGTAAGQKDRCQSVS